MRTQSTASEQTSSMRTQSTVSDMRIESTTSETSDSSCCEYPLARPRKLGPDIPTNTAEAPPNAMVGMSKAKMYDLYTQYRKLYCEATAVEIVAFIKARPRLPEEKRNAVDRLTYWLEDNGGGYLTVSSKLINIPRRRNPHQIKHLSPEDVVRNTNGGEIHAEFKLYVSRSRTPDLHSMYEQRTPRDSMYEQRPRRATFGSVQSQRNRDSQYTCIAYGNMGSLTECCGCVVISNVNRNQLFQDYLIHLAYTMNYGIALCSDVTSSDKYVYHDWKTVKSFINPRTRRPLIIKTIDIQKMSPIIHRPTNPHPWLCRKRNLRFSSILGLIP